MERAHPEPIELAMVLIAPAPGVREMRTAAPSRVNQSDHDTAASVVRCRGRPGGRPRHRTALEGRVVPGSRVAGQVAAGTSGRARPDGRARAASAVPIVLGTFGP
ncbi:hypothetical protein GCM10027080_14500 [Pedococcus soli]